MSNVIDINRKESKGRQRPVNNVLDLDQAVFFAGVMLTMVVPTIVYCAFRGPVRFSVFACTALTGTIIGIANYLFVAPYRLVSITPKPARAVMDPAPHRIPSQGPRTPPTADTDRKRAA